jgi:hypothetical protein
MTTTVVPGGAVDGAPAELCVTTEVITSVVGGAVEATTVEVDGGAAEEVVEGAAEEVVSAGTDDVGTAEDVLGTSEEVGAAEEVEGSRITELMEEMMEETEEAMLDMAAVCVDHAQERAGDVITSRCRRPHNKAKEMNGGVMFD